MTRKEFFDMRRQYQKEMSEELIRIEMALDSKGINVVPNTEKGQGNRYIEVENVSDDLCRIFRILFEVPESINLEKVVWWFVNKTKYSECTVYTDGRNPTTIRTNNDIKWYFK